MLSGESEVDRALVTGESLPVPAGAHHPTRAA
ncbi:hypothetical protein [Saccharomonospora viridis]